MALPVEIFSMILLQTDTRTLLTAQRVRRQWRELIQTQRALQEALFFNPSPHPRDKDAKPAKNPLLEEIVWPYFLRTYLVPQSDHARVMVPLRRRDIRRDAAFLRPEASWRHMLLA